MAEYIECGTEYVERTAAMRAAVRYFQNTLKGRMDEYGLMNAINHVPTADVVEVVRCKDCKYNPEFETKRKGWVWCRNFRTEVKSTGFCSYGERRGE